MKVEMKSSRRTKGITGIGSVGMGMVVEYRVDTLKSTLYTSMKTRTDLPCVSHNNNYFKN